MVAWTLVNYKIRNGRAIYQGGIVLGRANEIPKERSDGSSNKVKEREGSLLVRLNGAYLWPKGVVPYTFAPGLPQRVITAIRSAIYTNNTPIRWVQRTNEADYVVFQLLTADDGSCGNSDSIGVAGGEQHVECLLRKAAW